MQTASSRIELVLMCSFQWRQYTERGIESECYVQVEGRENFRYCLSTGNSYQQTGI